MVPVAWQALDLRVEGFVSKPTIARSRRSVQHFFVNGRPIRSGLLAVMLERPYAGRLPPGRYPLAVIHITWDPRYVDVNVHPRKAEIRFSQERTVYGAVSDAVREALSDYPMQPEWAEQGGAGWPFAHIVQPGGAAVAEEAAPYGSGARVLAQLHYTYILAQSDDGLLIADQHAAHEQVLFERLVQGGKRVALNPPPRLNLVPREGELLEQIVPVLDELGVEVDPFGGQAWLIRSLPAEIGAALQGQDPGFLVTALIQESMRCKGGQGELKECLAMKAACLGAVKAGDPLSPERMQRLLDDLAQVWSPTVCPHGRPAVVSISMVELHRRFGRT